MKIKSLAFSLPFFCLIALSCSIAAKTATVPNPPGFSGNLAPSGQFSQTAIAVTDFLKAGHYQHLAINDALSAKILDRYLLDLDKSHSYFTQKDIKEFEKFRDRLDDDLHRGDLTAAYEIFIRYKQRMIERLTFMIRQLDAGLDTLDFQKDESLDIMREQIAWPADIVALDDLWRKRLKNAVLILKLSGKSDNEISEQLKSRFQNQLKRAHQFKSSDVFQLYMNALTGLYDPHTQYFSPRTSENFDINMKLSLEGIGAVLQAEDEYVKVLRLVPAGPADSSGLLKPTDRIIGVGQGKNGKIIDVTGWRLDDVVDLIRGPKKSVVRLEILSGQTDADSTSKRIAITRDTVKLEEQSAKKAILEIERDGEPIKVGVIDIPTFYSDFRAQRAGEPDYKSTTRDVHRLLYELKGENIQGLVIDLRDNSGGSLQEALTLTGLFIKTGPLVQIRNSKGQIQVLGDRDPTLAYRGPLVVLVNRMSASASEIFAGAIQDYQRGIVIGGQTFGKGTVQSLQALQQGQLKLTLSKFYRVSGASTQYLGVTPDVRYPSLYNLEDIGESSLPNALQWDRIDTVHYPIYGNMATVIDELRDRHKARTTNAPGFEYLVERRQYQDELKGKKTVSLNETIRRQERVKSDKIQLQLENKRRLAVGLKRIHKLSELDDEKMADTANKIDRNDPVLKESVHIVADLIDLRQPVVASYSAEDDKKRKMLGR